MEYRSTPELITLWTPMKLVCNIIVLYMQLLNIAHAKINNMNQNLFNYIPEL